MAQVLSAPTDALSTFRLTTLSGAGTNQQVRAYAIQSGGAAQNWGELCTQGGAFGTATASGTGFTGSIQAWASSTSTGAPATPITWRVNSTSRTLVFESTNAFWLCFCYDDPAGTTYNWDDSGWTVSFTVNNAGAGSGIFFLWGSGCRHTSGSALTSTGGFNYMLGTNFQPNGSYSVVPTARNTTAYTSYNTVLNFNGCTLNWPSGTTTTASTLRADIHWAFPDGFSGNIRNMVFNSPFNNTGTVPNLTLSAPSTVNINGVIALRHVWCPGNPLTTNPTVINGLQLASQAGQGDRQQPLSASRAFNFRAFATNLVNPSWRSHRLNLRTGGGSRSLIPQLFDGWGFFNFTDGTAINTNYTNFYTTTSATPRNSGVGTPGPFHQYELNYPGARTDHVYETVYQCPYLDSPTNPDGSFKTNTYKSFTNGGVLDDGTRTRYIPQYGIVNNVMTRPFPVNTTDTTPQKYAITTNGQLSYAAALYMFGRADTTATQGFFANFTPAFTDSATLSPIANLTYDPTQIQVNIYDKWGSPLELRTQTAQNSQFATAIQLVLTEDLYIKAPDDTAGSTTNRDAALAQNVTVTQISGLTSNIQSITVGAAMDGSTLYNFLEAWKRVTYLRPLSNWGSPTALQGALAFTTSVTAFTVGGIMTQWIPTTGRLAINRIILIAPTAVLTFNAGTLNGNLRFECPNINVNSQAIVQDLIASTSITNLVTSGTIVDSSTNAADVNFGSPGSTVVLTGNVFFIVTNGSLTGNLALNPNGNTTRVVSFTGATIANLSGFLMTNPTTAVPISLVGWPNGMAIPAGFQVLSNFSVLLPNTVGTPLVNVRVNKLFRNSLAANVTNPTLTITSNGLMLTWSGNAADRFSYCGFIDGLAPIFFDKPANSGDSPAPQGGAIIDPDNLDFTQRANFTAGDTTFINATTWTIGLNNIVISAPTAIYDRSNSRPVSKMVIRAIMENANATPYHLGIATNAISNTIPLVNAIVFNSLGTMSQTGWALLFAKSASSPNVVVLNLWNIDQTGTQRTISSLDVTTQIQFAGFSPGAVAELTGADLALIGIAASEGNLPALNTISARINQASLLIPSTTTPIT